MCSLFPMALVNILTEHVDPYCYQTNSWKGNEVALTNEMDPRKRHLNGGVRKNGQRRKSQIRTMLTFTFSGTHSGHDSHIVYRNVTIRCAVNHTLNNNLTQKHKDTRVALTDTFH